MDDRDRIIPADPLDFIQRCIHEQKVLWTYHVQMRLRGRSISRATIFEAKDSFEIIESYPDDKYLPSYLIYLRHLEDVFHVLMAADVTGDNIRTVTAYRPNLSEWHPDQRHTEEEPMKCQICGETLDPVVTDLPFKLSQHAIVVIRDLPVLQCKSCPEYLLDDLVMERIEEMLDGIPEGAELEVVRYAA